VHRVLRVWLVAPATVLLLPFLLLLFLLLLFLLLLFLLLLFLLLLLLLHSLFKHLFDSNPSPSISTALPTPRAPVVHLIANLRRIRLVSSRSAWMRRASAATPSQRERCDCGREKRAVWVVRGVGVSLWRWWWFEVVTVPSDR